jgi:hypothetical protein
LRAEGVVTVARTFSRGVLKGYGKTSRSRRRVQLSAGAEAALDAIVPRLDSPLRFPGPREARIDLQLPGTRMDARTRGRGPPAQTHLRPPPHRDLALARGRPRLVREVLTSGSCTRSFDVAAL